MTEKRYRQLVFALISLFIIGIGLLMFRIELGVYLMISMFIGFIILALHWLLIGFWEEGV